MPADIPSHVSSAADMRLHLQALLDAKEKQLQQAGALGQRVLAQQVELEDRIRQLHEMELDRGADNGTEIDATMRERYRELAETVRTWDSENAQMSNAFGFKRPVNGSQPSPTFPSLELPREEPERPRPAASSSNAQSRRAKNAAHRADDVEFAFEIGSGLLTEVRRLQSLLAERDKAIQDMKEEKDDIERTVESLRTALKQQEQSADKYKEENWNLEVTLQELRTQLSDTQASVQRLDGEHKRLNRLLNQSRETVDKHKNEAQQLQSSLDDLKAKHDTDIAQARKHAASLQRDKSDLQQSLDTLKTEMSRQGRRLPRFGSPYTPEARSTAGNTDLVTPNVDREDDEFFSAGASMSRRRGDASAFLSDRDPYDSSPDVSPTRPILSPNHPSNEVEALQQRLAHAQRQINTLKGTLQREKELKIEYRKRLESPMTGTGLGAEEDVSDEDTENVRPSAVQPSRGRRGTSRRVGHGTRGARGRGGHSLLDRLHRAANRPHEEDEDGYDEMDAASSPLASIPTITRFGGAEVDDNEDEMLTPDMGTPQQPADESPANRSSRASLDDLDPAFAHAIRRSSSSGSIPYNRSPLQNAVTARSLGRRVRGGAAFQEARPPSLIHPPEALAAELFGMGMGSVAEIASQVETAEFGCQTNTIEEPAPLIPAAPLLPALPKTSECGVQVDPEPSPEVVKPVTLDVEIQTTPEPIAKRVTVESGVQHEPIDQATLEPETREIGVNAVIDVEHHDFQVQTESDLESNSVEPIAHMDSGVQHESTEPQKTYASSSIETDSSLSEMTPTPTVIPLPETSVAGVQTDAQSPTLAGDLAFPGSRATGLRRGTLTQESFGSGGLAYAESVFDDDATETGVDTDTDAEFHDARSVARTTPSMSTNDFQSAHDLSDTANEDTRASTPTRSQSVLARVGVSPYAPRVTYDEQGVQAELSEPSKAEDGLPTVSPENVTESVVVPDVNKPEVREVSIQTEEWSPPPPSTPGATPFKLGGVGLQQFQYISPTTPGQARPSPSTPASPLANTTRDSTITVIPRPRLSTADRRQSIESALDGNVDEDGHRARVPSLPVPASPLLPVDKSRPPMMTLPPPPRAPPPPGSMPPPPFVPDRNRHLSGDLPPGRPISPPPAELIQRATTPTFGSLRSNFSSIRQPGSSMPPMQVVGSRPSTNSFRSSNVNNAYAQGYVPASLQAAFAAREMSQTSLQSGGSIGSARSSISSEHPFFPNRAHGTPSGMPSTPGVNNPLANGAPGGSTDPAVIHAITQTMIGEYLYKYTRKPIGKGYGDRRHKRFFWVHPYTKTLYWSDTDPGSSNVTESSAKSAYIESVRSVLDPNPLPPGLHQYSVIVSTPHREMKITAPTKERHDIWLNALKYLLARPNAMPIGSPRGGTNLSSTLVGSSEVHYEDGRQTQMLSSPRSFRSGRSIHSIGEWNITPRGQRSRSRVSLGGSIGKRSGTPAAEYLRYTGRDGPHSPTKSTGEGTSAPAPAEDDDLDFELNDDTLSDNAFEGLENVRACCDGRHTVGGHHHHHHHQHEHQNTTGSREAARVQNQQQQQHLDSRPPDPRPSSPAFSFRSRAGSGSSHDGGLFSGRLRFGSRRSTKTSVPTIPQDIQS